MKVASPCETFAAGLRSTNEAAIRMIGNDLTQEQALFQVAPGTSHILWLAGHLVYATGHIAAHAIGIETDAADRCTKLFDMGSKPLADPSGYPAIGDVCNHLATETQRVVSALEGMDASLLEKPTPSEVPVAEMLPTVGQFLGALPGHNMYHVGQIVLLRRAQGLPGGFGM